MTTPKTGLKSVPDTNVLLAAKMSKGPTSPNCEYIERWKHAEFKLLYSLDTYLEYIEKIIEKGLAEDVIRSFLRALMELGDEVFVEHYHLPAYPVDIDDVAFLLCAVNGEATHLITYDRHLLELSQYYWFKVCGTVHFLRELRQALRAAEQDATSSAHD